MTASVNAYSLGRPVTLEDCEVEAEKPVDYTPDAYAPVRALLREAGMALWYTMRAHPDHQRDAYGYANALLEAANDLLRRPLRYDGGGQHQAAGEAGDQSGRLIAQGEGAGQG